MVDRTLREGLWRFGNTTYGPANHHIFLALLLTNKHNSAREDVENNDDRPHEQLLDVETLDICGWRVSWAATALVDLVVMAVIKQHLKRHPHELDAMKTLDKLLDSYEHVV